MTIETDNIYLGNCLDIMKDIEDNSIDCIICDLPYGTTSCPWDIIIPFDRLWEEYYRILKPKANVVLFCSGKFTYELINSNLKNFKYKLIWKKNVPTGMGSAKYRPMKYYEEICIFNDGNGTYNPIMKERIGIGKGCYNYDHYCGKSNHITFGKQPKRYDPDFVQPSDILEFNVVPNRNGKLHPTQKPVELLEWLVKTYSNENDVILDNCIGSGSTAIACINAKRHYIGIELDDKYWKISVERIAKHKQEREA